MKSIIFGASRKVLKVLNRLFKNLVQWIDAFVMGGWNCPGHTIHTLTITSLLVVNPLKKFWLLLRVRKSGFSIITYDVKIHVLYDNREQGF